MLASEVLVSVLQVQSISLNRHLVEKQNNKILERTALQLLAEKHGL